MGNQPCREQETACCVTDTPVVSGALIFGPDEGHPPHADVGLAAVRDPHQAGSGTDRTVI